MAWSLPLAGIPLLLLTREVPAPFMALTLIVILVGALWAVAHPDRGLQDRIAGTTLASR